jgi:hypothetical protein
MIIDREALATGMWQLVEPVILGDGVHLADLMPEERTKLLDTERGRLEKANLKLMGELAIGPVAQVFTHDLVDSDVEAIGIYQFVPKAV